MSKARGKSQSWTVEVGYLLDICTRLRTVVEINGC